MFQRKLATIATRFAVLLLCLSTIWFSATTYAQTGESIAELKERANALTKQTRYTEALPLLEKIVVAEPDNAEMHYYLAFALVGQAANTKDDAKRKALLIRARNAFIKSKELGIKEPNVDALIQGLPVDGSDGGAFSQNPEANELMVEAEALFSQGKLDDALKNYQKALELDSKIYEAALFSADVFMSKENFAQAEIWYQKAIAINPNRETAYR